MAVRKGHRRVGREQLAMAVRKNFNGLAIQEGEVVVDFLYKVRWQGKCLFPPTVGYWAMVAARSRSYSCIVAMRVTDPTNT
jgi:Sin3 binding region of histone deacetylase complex subunit SAP30